MVRLGSQPHPFGIGIPISILVATHDAGHAKQFRAPTCNPARYAPDTYVFPEIWSPHPALRPPRVGLFRGWGLLPTRHIVGAGGPDKIAISAIRPARTDTGGYGGSSPRVKAAYLLGGR